MWCPKCKTEYRKGISVCADCGTPLVEGKAEDFQTVDICELKEEQMADRFMEYLTYSKVEGVQKSFDEEKGIYRIIVPEKMEKKAERLFEGFMKAMEEDQEKEKEEKRMQSPEDEEESAQAPEEAEDVSDDTLQEDETDEEAEEYDWDAEEQPGNPAYNPFEEDEEKDIQLDEDAEDDASGTAKALLYESTREYVKKEDQYKDLLFSGLTFIIFGVLGVVYLILCKLDVLPIEYNIVVFGGLSIMFLLFVIGGIVSVVKAVWMKPQIPIEQEKTKQIQAWLEEKLTEDIVEKWRSEDVSEEENDLLVMAHIRKDLAKQYPEEEMSYLEMITEEYFTEHIQSQDQDA